MKRLKADLLQFFHCKAYVCAMSLVALCCYGYTIAHPSIGMDDTAIGLYFQEGPRSWGDGLSLWQKMCFICISVILLHG